MMGGPDGTRIERRTILRNAAFAAAASVLPRTALADPAAGRLKLRLLETSDLHMFIDDYDYFRDRQDNTVGLAKTATLIKAARAEARNSLLFDNGDLLQGNPLADFMADGSTLKPAKNHPMFRVMNQLGYDAATVGNHEFNYGLDFLTLALHDAKFRLVSANILRVDGTTYLPPWTTLKRRMVDENGKSHELRIGVIGFCPPQIMTWDKSRLIGKLSTIDVVEAAQHHVPNLRKEADIVVALCHGGISTAPRQGGDENAAFYLADVPGIDVIFTGHSHRVFPGPDYAGRPGIDANRGTLNGIPAAMPGFWGSHLGLIDLDLVQTNGKWRVADFAVEARPIYRRDGNKVTPLVQPDESISAAITPEHRATLDYIRQSVGSSAVPITSYFSLAVDDPSVALINDAQIWYFTPIVASTPYAGLPILSAAAPMKAGGSPENYTDIPAGPLALKNAADLYPYSNYIRAVVITGAAVNEWLERSALVFAQVHLDQGAAPQPLLSNKTPAYNFDIISGVTYQVDLTQPPRYDSKGKLVNETAHRIVNLRYLDKPIDHERKFVVVTNDYRADGGGYFPGLGNSTTIIDAPDSNRDVVIRYVRDLKTVSAKLAKTWSFAPLGQPLTVYFDSGPDGRRYLADYPAITDAGEGDKGFARYTIQLS